MMQPELMQDYIQEAYAKKVGENSASQSDIIPFPNQDKQFLQWLLDFRKHTTIPQRYLWKGYELNDNGKWVKRKDDNGKELNFQVMNDTGITWAISYIEGFVNPVFITTNYNWEQLCFQAKRSGRVVINNLCARFKEFGMHRLDIPRVYDDIMSKIEAVLLGAENNGFRLFLQTTHTTSEVKTMQDNPNQRGFMPGVTNFFNRNKPIQ